MFGTFGTQNTDFIRKHRFIFLKKKNKKAKQNGDVIKIAIKTTVVMSKALPGQG